MPAYKIYAQKKGAVHTVYIDLTTNQPIPVATPEDQPPGAFPFTFSNRAELNAKYPGAEVITLETPTKDPVIVRRDKKMRKESEAILAKMRAANPIDVTVVRETPPQGAGILMAPQHNVQLSSFEAKATEFLKRLEYAERFASPENLITLAVQILVVKELMDEVFRG